MGASYSESWYQVAQERVCLLPTVRIHKQLYRKRIWYVLQDSCSEKYFRLGEKAYRFVASLSPEKTVEECWAAFLEKFPEDAPSQDDVISLLSQLHQMNLLLFRSVGKSEVIFERFQKQRRRELMTYLLAFLYFRVPLWNPNRFLKANNSRFEKIFSPWAFAVWCVVIALGIKSVAENWPALGGQAQGILAIDNLFWLYVAMFVLKIFHEMGHAVVCRKYGGDVHNMGAMFIALAPLPYIDASASWSMRSRLQRAQVGLAGMYVELFFAAIGALVWSITAPGFVNSMAFNVMIIGSISSIIFNGNPLLKFDAYYVLSDLIDIPNLYQKSIRQWFWLGKRVILRVQDSEEPAESRYERRWFYSYGFLSFLYRLFVMWVILLYMADISLILGFLMVLALSWMWVLSPLGKLFHYLMRNPELRKNRSQASGAAVGTIATILLFLAFVPMPNSMVAPGVVLSDDQYVAFAESGGVLSGLRVRSGEAVKAGQVILELDQTDLELEHKIVGNQLLEVRWLMRQALESAPIDVPSLQETESFLLERLDEIEARMLRMPLVAQRDGVWISSLGVEHLGTYVPRAQRLGAVLTQGGRRFVSVVSQDQIAGLLRESDQRGKVLLRGAADQVFEVPALKFIPFQRYELPSPALGIPGGGKIMAAYDERGKMMSQEPFFEVSAPLPTQVTEAVPDGALGYIRIRLSPKPLLQQGWLAIRQITQSRYSI